MIQMKKLETAENKGFNCSVYLDNCTEDIVYEDEILVSLGATILSQGDTNKDHEFSVIQKDKSVRYIASIIQAEYPVYIKVSKLLPS